MDHEDEFPARDTRKRNNKTCVFGCLENVTVDGQVYPFKLCHSADVRKKR